MSTDKEMYAYIKNRDEFYLVKEEEIINLEKAIGYPLPYSFKKFYLEVGWGKFVFEDKKLQAQQNFFASSLYFGYECVGPKAISFFRNKIFYDK